MAGVPQNFQAFSNVLSNYNFVDIASGTGYINFYAGKTVDKNLLSNYAYYSDVLYTVGSVSVSDTLTLIIDLDFDTVLNRPMDIKGLGIVNIPIYHNGIGYNYVVVTLRKWNGVTETDIITNQSRTITGALQYAMLAVDLDIPLTHFKIGETIRLSIQCYGYENEAGGNEAYIAHDPKSRISDGTLTFDASGAVPSQLVFQLPVRLNL